MGRIKNKRQLQMMRHTLMYEEKILHRDLSDASAEIISDLNWRVRDYVFDFGSKIAMELIQNIKKKKAKYIR